MSHRTHKKDRPSPSQSATLYKVGTIKKGNDGNLWVIAENKNMVKRWKLYKMEKDRKKLSTLNGFGIVPVDSSKLEKVIKKSSNNVQKIYTIIKNKIIPGLEKLGLVADIVPLPLSNQGVYWTDYPSNYLKEKHGDNWFNNHWLYFIIYLDKTGQSLGTYQDIKIHYLSMNGSTKIKVIKLFKDALRDKYKWNGNNNTAMTIYYTERH